MHGPLVALVTFVLEYGVLVHYRLWIGEGLGLRRHIEDGGCRLEERWHGVGHRFDDGWIVGRRTGRDRARTSARRTLGRSGSFLPSRRRHLGRLVFMIRIAGRAAGLLHLLFDHGDDYMVGHAALARTVVVQNVTEPNPALLHELPRSDLQAGRVKSE